VPIPATGPQILYIDDDESMVFLVERLMERRGHRVTGFINQLEALAALRADTDKFDLVVTDYNMPGMSGLDVAREIHKTHPKLVVAIASGFIDETLRAGAEAAGVHELIFKATDVAEFCEAFVRLANKAGRKFA
jgi:DNA-binding NtrC family response regulator